MRNPCQPLLPSLQLQATVVDKLQDRSIRQEAHLQIHSLQYRKLQDRVRSGHHQEGYSRPEEHFRVASLLRRSGGLMRDTIMLSTIISPKKRRARLLSCNLSASPYPSPRTSLGATGICNFAGIEDHRSLFSCGRTGLETHRNRIESRRGFR